MMTPTGVVLRKALTANDTGETGSHQVGIHIPKSLIPYFPPLDESARNPDRWLDIEGGGGHWQWRYIHYNKALFGEGTRDEYRLTHVSGFFGSVAPMAGDILELVQTCPGAFRVGIARGGAADDRLVLVTTGPWKVVRMR